MDICCKRHGNHVVARAIPRTQLGYISPFSSTTPCICDKNHPHLWTSDLVSPEVVDKGCLHVFIVSDLLVDLFEIVGYLVYGGPCFSLCGIVLLDCISCVYNTNFAVR